jgi:hypothetical protein
MDLSEKGRSPSGEIISLDRRLYMQLLVFREDRPHHDLTGALEQADFSSVLYADLNHPRGYGLLLISEDADCFAVQARHLLNQPPFAGIRLCDEFTMFGRTYAMGYEHDLQRVLIERPLERATNPEHRWAVWYPVRRSGEFERLPAEEQRTMLMEHGGIGQAYGEAGLAHDIRLASYGLNKKDDDFVVGLVGPDLHPLSRIVERMRKTRQTSEYLTSLGPFFIGRTLWQRRLA